jgi:hypothetical protein
MRKLGGHVFQPLTEWISRYTPIPEDWTAHANCAPEFCEVFEKLSTDCDRLSNKMTKRLQPLLAGLVLPRMSLSSPRFGDSFARALIHSEAHVTLSSLAPLKASLKLFTVAPIDKQFQEAMVL